MPYSASKKVKFYTNAGCPSSGSGGPFSVAGFGEIPTSCHNSPSASCTIDLCNQNSVVVTAGTSDRWVFDVAVDGTKVAPRETCSVDYARGLQHECCGSSSLETDQHSHVVEEFNWSKQYKRCHDVKFITSHCSSASSGGPFTVEGYGTLPASCYNSMSGSCTISVCDQPQLIVEAGTSDRWVYYTEIDGIQGTPQYTCGQDYGVASECCGHSSLETDQHTHVLERFQW